VGQNTSEIQTITGWKEDTHFPYLREIRKQHGKKFIEQGDNINDEIALSSQMLYDQLCKLYSLCVQRLTNNSDSNSKDYSDTSNCRGVIYQSISFTNTRSRSCFEISSKGKRSCYKDGKDHKHATLKRIESKAFNGIQMQTQNYDKISRML